MAEGDILIFDRRALRRHRERAARRGCAEFLLEEASERLAQRLEDVTHRFPRALALGARGGILARALAGRGGIESLIEMEEGPGLLPAGEHGALVAEAEALPFAPSSFDLVASALALHWTNDLPGALLQLRHLLRPDGMLLAALFGGETLTELRAAFLEAELELEGGASPRVAPMADARDLAGLLQRAGFALPVVDSDRLTVTYGDAFALMADLRAMGETNALRERRRGFTRRQTLLRMAELYRERHAGADGRIPASFEIVTLTAWAPHASQPKPLRPGSATTRLADALGTQEKSAGEKTGR
ncbi:MAG TPA: methyltransferase domain-containing protein [Stellaceae bacterium]|nr:methyltransferase domain-containing protein [Stellaceae bacterium]